LLGECHTGIINKILIGMALIQTYFRPIPSILIIYILFNSMYGIKMSGRSDIYEALSNRIRREIILLLGEHGALRAKDLKEFLNIGPGQLYYHLSLLGDLVTKNDKKEYVLTELGLEVYRAITRDEAPQIPGDASIQPSPLARILSMILFPKAFFYYIYESPYRHLVDVGIILLFGGYLSFLSGFRPILLLPVDMPGGLVDSYIYFIGSILFVTFLSDILSTVLFRRGGGHLNLFIGVIFSYIPIIVFYILIYVTSLTALELRLLYGGWLLRGVMVLCQGYSITLLASSIGAAKNIRIDKSALVSLSIAYISIVLYLVLVG